jgi:DtxR family Mn-dependent transcriptional regulator
MPEEAAYLFTSPPEHRPTSESEEMYLITVARAAEEGATGPIPVAGIAGALHVSIAAANEMIRKLEARGLLEYRPYRGAALTAAGSRIADRVLRTRRIWATFLADHLEFTPAEADALACHLEHVTAPDAADRLGAWLGEPDTGPLGRPIPPSAPHGELAVSMQLLDAEPGVVLEVVAVSGDRATVSFLAAEGIAAGREVSLEARGESALLVTTPTGRVHLGKSVAAAIGVRAVQGAG